MDIFFNLSAPAFPAKFKHLNGLWTGRPVFREFRLKRQMLTTRDHKVHCGKNDRAAKPLY